MARKRLSAVVFFPFLVILSTLVSGHIQQQTDGTARDTTGWNYQTTATGHSGAGHEYHPQQTIQTNQRQALGNPFFAFFPIILIAGLGLLVLMPLFLMFFSSGFGGGGFGGGFQGTSPFGRKRSIDGFGGAGGGLIELVQLVTTAIDKQAREYETSFKPKKDKN